MKTTNKNASHACFQISGTVKSVYRGKDYDFATVKVDRVDDPDHYDMIRVACPKSIEVEEDDSIKCSGVIFSYYNRVKHMTEYFFRAKDFDQVLFSCERL